MDRRTEPELSFLLFAEEVGEGKSKVKTDPLHQALSSMVRALDA